MHEIGLACEIHRIARAAADDACGSSLESVMVVIGDLAAVEPDLLEFAWRAVVEGTPDEGARLLIEWKRARQECASCGPILERAAGSWLRICPRCDGLLAVTGGDELEVRRVSFSAESATVGGEVDRD